LDSRDGGFKTGEEGDKFEDVANVGPGGIGVPGNCASFELAAPVTFVEVLLVDMGCCSVTHPDNSIQIAVNMLSIANTSLLFINKISRYKLIFR
jgi:hypothetical protein